MPAEKRSGLTQGDNIGIIETEKVKIGIAICYEMEFPEIARKLALNGGNFLREKRIGRN